jgi:hypothetical protein
MSCEQWLITECGLAALLRWMPGIDTTQASCEHRLSCGH